MYTPENKEELDKLIFQRKVSLCRINTTKITDISYLFNGTNFNRLNGTISDWDVSNVTNMSYTFGESIFNQDISKWNTSNVTDMSYMFAGSIFNRDISKWDVSNVTSCASMFYHNTKFNQDISKWDVSNVTDMNFMFANSGFNQDISKWNIKSVRYLYMMFSYSKIRKIQMFKGMNTFPTNMYDGTAVEDEWKEIIEIIS